MWLSKELTYSYVVIRLLIAAFWKDFWGKAKGPLCKPEPRCGQASASHSRHGVLCPGPGVTPDFLQVTAQKQVTCSGSAFSVLSRSRDCLGHHLTSKAPYTQVLLPTASISIIAEGQKACRWREVFKNAICWCRLYMTLAHSESLNDKATLPVSRGLIRQQTAEDVWRSSLLITRNSSCYSAQRKAHSNVLRWAGGLFGLKAPVGQKRPSSITKWILTLP